MNFFTSGYQGETILAFLNKLSNENIQAIIDIRIRPLSRKPGFSKKSLRKALNSVGIQYFHYRELGTPEPLRQILANDGNYSVFFERYKSFLPEFRDSLDDLLDIGREKKVCIMCFEKDHKTCHRKVVAELIREYAGQEIQIVHL